MPGINGENNCTNASERFAKPMPGEEIVISGIGGRFPESRNVREFKENLLNKKNLVTYENHRWEYEHPNLPPWTGKVSDIEKFDATFFGVHAKQTNNMDPMGRMLLENAYEAIIDSGVNPRTLCGTNTGVFVGNALSETDNAIIYQKLQVTGFGVTGCSRSMLANRLSWWLGTHGPSFTVDTACSSSTFALDNAYQSMREGNCDAAIVAGTNLCLGPAVTLQFSSLGFVSPDGECRAFDETANGYNRSEAIAVIFLQKAKNAKRIYATVVHSGTNYDGSTREDITCPSPEIPLRLLKGIYEECGVPPSSVSYVEANGNAKPKNDSVEMSVLEEVFLDDRSTPLLVGSVKSNMGNSEAASGVSSIIKVVLGMEAGCIPPNLHFKTPQQGMKALQDGRIQIVTEPTQWRGGYAGVNSFSFTGANAHVLLKSHTKEKVNDGMPNDELPRLVAVSGRTQEAVETLLNDLKSRPVDVEYVRLLHDIHSFDTPGHLYRGFTILPARGIAETPTESCQRYEGAKRPIWFVFSGMGSQWSSMGATLMKFPLFFEAVKKCDTVLKPRGLDIFDILTNEDPKMFDNIVHSFVGIATVQIGLVDILSSIGIVPDNIIGHSVGELGCAYADGCLTAEQMILSAYSRGMASLETEFIRGSMAAVGLGYAQLKNLCPDDIDIACHNGPASSTISGPAESMQAFVADLKAKNIFAREVPCSNIAYHSRYITRAGPTLLAYLSKIIPDPKPRSNKWLSSSVPQDKWTSPAARLCSAEYHTNNLLSPVLFEETSKNIPKDAITIEIAPHGLLQAIINKSLPSTVTNISLTRRGQHDNAKIVLEALGKLYQVGLHPQLDKLYPEVPYPVSRGTPMISPLIRWNHTDNWSVLYFESSQTLSTGERRVDIGPSSEDYEYTSGYVIDGQNVIPPTAYLQMVWQTLGMIDGRIYTDMSVVFKNVKFLRRALIPRDEYPYLTIVITRGTGDFAVVSETETLVTGTIRRISNPAEERIDVTTNMTDINVSEELLATDAYKILRVRGYQHTGLFRGITKAHISGTRGRIAWSDNYAVFLDNMIQIRNLCNERDELVVPTVIEKLVIDTESHSRSVANNFDIPVQYHPNVDAITTEGIEIKGLLCTSISHRKPSVEPVLEKCLFVAHRDRAEIPLGSVIRLAVQLAVENHVGNEVKTIELIDKSIDVHRKHMASLLIGEVLRDVPALRADLNIITLGEEFTEGEIPSTIKLFGPEKLTVDEDALLFVTHGLFGDENLKLLTKIQSAIPTGGFLLTIETLDKNVGNSLVRNKYFDIILEKRTDSRSVILLRKKPAPTKIVSVIRVTNKEFSWLPKVQQALRNEIDATGNANNRILLVSEGDFESGIVGLVNRLREEPGGEHIRGLFVQDARAPRFSLEKRFYIDQLKLDLVHNVVRYENIWGSYRLLALEPITLEPVNRAFVHQFTSGDISSLAWVQGPIERNPKPKKVVDVHYSSVNSRDVLLATGSEYIDVIPQTSESYQGLLGFEYSGIETTDKRRVMGIISSGTLSNTIATDEHLQWEVPANWSLEDAVTVPVAYGTAFYALYELGKMMKGQKVLIHAGSGGVGQAAITLALHESCEVFTTVGTPEKREFIKKKFPQIDDNHIGNSRDISFECLILRQTGGKGVDIVLNSLSQEKLQASVHCLTHGGRFLQIGKLDLVADNSLGLGIFLKELAFHGINLDDLFTASVEKKKHFQSNLDKAIKNGIVKPLGRTVFAKQQIEEAFRFMEDGKHIGKVIIKIHDDNQDRDFFARAVPRYYCSPDSSYLIHDGLSSCGLELAEWLTLRGARKLIFTSRDEINSGYQRRRMNLWKTRGIDTLIIVGKDASTPEDCEAIFKQAVALGPVDAIFNVAAISEDSLSKNQAKESFEESLRIKAGSTKQFDTASRIYCPQLRHFVVFLSVSCGRGNAEQTNYGMATSIMERICEKRMAEGLPALAIKWGPIGDIEVVPETQEDLSTFPIGGMLQQEISSCLQQLDELLQQKVALVSSMMTAEKEKIPLQTSETSD